MLYIYTVMSKSFQKRTHTHRRTLIASSETTHSYHPPNNKVMLIPPSSCVCVCVRELSKIL